VIEEFYERNSTDVPELDERLRSVARLVERSRPSRVLDVACGRGALLAELRRRMPGTALTGADISNPSVEAVRALGIDAVRADLSAKLPFEDESFDCVVFGEVIEHIVDPDFALQELSRILKAGGLLIVTTPNLASWFNRIFLLLGIQPIFTETSLHVNLGRRFEALGQWRPTQGHLKIFTESALREMLVGNGFAIEELLGAPFAEPNRLSWLDRRLARFPALASNFVVAARNRRTLRTNYPRRQGWH
jgi:methionine biosynthesis protein MetW